MSKILLKKTDMLEYRLNELRKVGVDAEAEIHG
jgi:hypothetical protein